MHALVLTGSPNPRSSTAALAVVAGRSLSALGSSVDTVDLSSDDGGVEGLRQAVAEADAVVLASPVHHAGYSGRLKTALDQLPPDAFSNRAVGLLSHGSGPRTGNVVCEQLRTVAKALGGWVVPTQVAGCPDDFGPGPGGTRGPNEDLLSRCDKLARELYRCATMLDRPAPAAVRDRV
ncbi:NADPH-dependent FMN reductase [Streptomyces sp. NPDC001700]